LQFTHLLDRKPKPRSGGQRQRVVIFFFQAEDGIRFGHVTGVQTCALPIYERVPGEPKSAAVERRARGLDPGPGDPGQRRALHARSEERRVGKESRSRASPQEWKKNNRTVT